MMSESGDITSDPLVGAEVRADATDDHQNTTPANTVERASHWTGDRNSSVVICAGQFGSGSTWVFNVASEILARRTGAKVVRRYLDEQTREDAFVNTNCISVVKTHIPPFWFFSLANMANISILLSTRDPRDAATSMMTRFDLDFEFIAQKICYCSQVLAPLAARPNVLLLRYEDKFTSRPETLDNIARHLGLELYKSERDEIFEKYTPEGVNKIITELADKGVLTDASPIQAVDEETQWHLSHVGDGRVGKWRDILTDAQAASISCATRSYRAHFGYAANSPIAPGTTIDFSNSGFGSDYLNDDFCGPELGGVWTTGERAMVEFGLADPLTKKLYISVKCSLGPTLLSDTPGAMLRVFINDREVAYLPASASNAHHLILSAWIEGGQFNTNSIVIDFQHKAC